MSTRDPRDDELERAWRDAARDEPPQRLDETILARAREAAARRKGTEEPPSELWPLPHPRTWLMRWRVPLAVAATLFVSATVTLLVYDAGMEEPPPVVTDRPLRPPAPPAPGGGVAERSATPTPPTASAPSVAPPQPSPDAAPAPAGRHEGRPVDRERAPRERAAGIEPGAEPRGRDAPADATAPEPKRAVESLGTSRETPAAALSPVTPAPESAPAAPVAPSAPRAAPAPMAASPSAARVPGPAPVPQAAPRDNSLLEKRDEAAQPAPAARAKAAAFATPEAYVERIRELKKAGRETEARELLEELKRRFPSFELPDDLKGR
jgi:Meckel syndrome type 1 protein